MSEQRTIPPPGTSISPAFDPAAQAQPASASKSPTRQQGATASWGYTGTMKREAFKELIEVSRRARYGEPCFVRTVEEAREAKAA
jgi:hypothetical protein